MDQVSDLIDLLRLGEPNHFFSPFDTTRYFFPWHVIEVSPIGLGNFVKYGGLDALLSEFLWVWLPVGVIATLVFLLRFLCKKRAALR